MAILYGLLCALASGLRLVASAGHTRARKRYERLQTSFEDHENEAKAHEVAVGRPVDYGAQLRLLKAYDAKEAARLTWVRAAQRLEGRKAREQWLKDLSGKKLPYTFGLLDMALVVQALERLGLAPTLESLQTLVQSLS
jgi:hypothetical protein